MSLVVKHALEKVARLARKMPSRARGNSFFLSEAIAAHKRLLPPGSSITFAQQQRLTTLANANYSGLTDEQQEKYEQAARESS